jgi:ribosomal protein S18 acetylase RimI-like enzyme
MNLIEVTNKDQAKEFLQVPKILYKGDPNWVCPLDVEIEGIFNPESNICFQNGIANRWVLKNSEGKLIGRIAAFIDYNKVNLYEQPTGGAGFFECINDQDAADLLFNTAKEWLSSKGMKAMQAPINFGENYNYQGVLIEGFMQQAYSMPYNYPYYKELFENYGFKNYFGQCSFHKDLSEGFPDHLVKFAEYTESRPGYSFEHFKFRNIDKYVDDFVITYNTIWSAFHDGYIPLRHKEIRKIIEEARMVIEEEFIWFSYNKGKPTGLMVGFPDLNQILKKLKNGKLNLLNKLKLLFYKKRAVTRSRIFIFGILPEYQNTGILAALFYQLVKILAKRPRYKEIELSWVGDYNPRMLSIYDKIGCKLMKKHVTYLYHFDPNVLFKRFNNEFEGKLYR